MKAKLYQRTLMAGFLYIYQVYFSTSGRGRPDAGASGGPLCSPSDTITLAPDKMARGETSVIVKWLKQHNLQQVQYLAVHRYISSTESYQQNDIETLKE